SSLEKQTKRAPSFECEIGVPSSVRQTHAPLAEPAANMEPSLEKQAVTRLTARRNVFRPLRDDGHCSIERTSVPSATRKIRTPSRPAKIICSPSGEKATNAGLFVNWMVRTDSP